jgi:uncharacterized protein YdhG (YjbR/CyaY superfamily)
MAKAKNIDAYIAGFPLQVRSILKRMRRTVLKAAPAAQEAISYRIPAFKLNGVPCTSPRSSGTSGSIRR